MKKWLFRLINDMKLRGKRKLYFSIIIFALFNIIMALIFFDSTPEERPNATIEPNVAYLDNISVDYLIDNYTYIFLKAKKGSYEMKSYNIRLKNMELIYKKDNTDMILFADNASYEKERIILADKNLHGIVNDIKFEGKKESRLRYDYVEDKGVIRNGIKALQHGNDIDAGSFHFGSQAGGDLLFKDDVIVNYFLKNNDKEQEN